MNKNMLVKVAVFACAAILFGAGCAENMSGGVYSQQQVMTEQSVVYGTVVSVHDVTIKAPPSGAGTLAGGVVGGVLGHNIGGGSGQTTATVLGAVGGAIAGNAVENKANTRPGYEITVKQDNDITIVVVQEKDPNETFTAGERVRVIRAANGTTRIRKP